MLTKCHRPGGLNLSSYSSGDWKSKIKVSTVLVPSESHGGGYVPLFVNGHLLPEFSHLFVHVCVKISFSYENAGHIGLILT